MNTHIAVKSSRLVMHVLRDAPPSVHPRGVLLVFVLRSKVRRSQEEFYLYTHLGGGGGGAIVIFTCGVVQDRWNAAAREYFARRDAYCSLHPKEEEFYPYGTFSAPRWCLFLQIVDTKVHFGSRISLGICLYRLGSVWVRTALKFACSSTTHIHTYIHIYMQRVLIVTV